MVLFRKGSKMQSFQHYVTKRVNMNIAYMKQTAHQEHLQVNLIKNLKACPLDR